MSVVQKLMTKIVSSDQMAALAEEMILGLIGEGVDEKVFRIERPIETVISEVAQREALPSGAQAPPPTVGGPGLVERPAKDLVCRTFYVAQRDPETGAIRTTIQTLAEFAQRIQDGVGRMAPAAFGLPGRLRTLLDAAENFLPGTDRYVLIGSENGAVSVEVVRIVREVARIALEGTEFVDENHVTEHAFLLREVLPDLIRAAKEGGHLDGLGGLLAGGAAPDGE